VLKAQLVLLEEPVRAVPPEQLDHKVLMVPPVSMVEWARAGPPVLPEIQALREQPVLRALLEVPVPEEILDSRGLRAPQAPQAQWV
jgi:hypothetical protein